MRCLIGSATVTSYPSWDPANPTWTEAPAQRVLICGKTVRREPSHRSGPGGLNLGSVLP